MVIIIWHPQKLIRQIQLTQRTKGFPLRIFKKLWKTLDSRRVVTILDCCYSGVAKLKEGKKGEGSEEAAKQARKAINTKMKPGKGKCILSACLDFQEAEKVVNKEYSIFTYYLLQGLKGNDNECVDKYGNVTASLLGNYVFDKVTSHEPREERPKQIPIVKTEFSGDIILARYPDKIKQEGINEYELLRLFQLLEQGKVKEFNDIREQNLNKSIDFHSINLAGANLEKVDLHEVNLNQANLEGAKLNGADLKGALLIGANLVQAILVEADLSEAYTYRADFLSVGL